MAVTIGGIPIGAGHPVYAIAEIGLNHNGSVELARQLIDAAADAGAQAVKFQKRTPHISTPEHMKSQPRDTPWGRMTYLEYRYRVEFDRDQYIEIGDYATLRGLSWFASPWDEQAVDFLEDLGVVAHKVASASVTDIALLTALAVSGKPIILSTGMSTLEQIDRAVEVLGPRRVARAAGIRSPGARHPHHRRSLGAHPPRRARRRSPSRMRIDASSRERRPWSARTLSSIGTSRARRRNASSAMTLRTTLRTTIRSTWLRNTSARSDGDLNASARRRDPAQGRRASHPQGSSDCEISGGGRRAGGS